MFILARVFEFSLLVSVFRKNDEKFSTLDFTCNSVGTRKTLSIYLDITFQDQSLNAAKLNVFFVNFPQSNLFYINGSFSAKFVYCIFKNGNLEWNNSLSI